MRTRKGESRLKYKCPCCGFYTFDSKLDGTYDICEVCFWEDDPIQLDDPDFEGGANNVYPCCRQERIFSGLAPVRKDVFLM